MYSSSISNSSYAIRFDIRQTKLERVLNSNGCIQRKMLLIPNFPSRLLNRLLQRKQHRTTHQHWRLPDRLGSHNTKWIRRPIQQLHPEIHRYILGRGHLIIPRAGAQILACILVMFGILHKEEANGHGKSAFDLTNVDQWVDAFADVKEDIHT